MGIVQEVTDKFPFDEAPQVLRRQEELLLADPLPGPVKLWQDQSPLEAVHFPQAYRPQKFAPPRGVYESDHIRIEWQTMDDSRQPFYHRNCDADELSYQVWGERTLMTELGSLEHVPGDFSRIPVGVAHDNYGRQESHLLFYIPAPVEERQRAVRTSELRIPPFPGWQAATVNELVTECLGAPGHDVAIFPSDERLLLEQAERDTARIQILRADDSGPETTWLYRSAQVWIGRTLLGASGGREYRRHRNSDEIQYQISGRRTLVTQRGALHLEPGDFVRIPVGVAFASVSSEQSAHITLVSAHAVPQVAAASKKAERVAVEEIDSLRRG